MYSVLFMFSFTSEFYIIRMEGATSQYQKGILKICALCGYVVVFSSMTEKAIFNFNSSLQ